jgi:hypothetical protein
MEHIKEDEISGTCGAFGGENKCLQSSGGEILKVIKN